jgi:preprotein translocase subunit SecA
MKNRADKAQTDKVRIGTSMKTQPDHIGKGALSDISHQVETILERSLSLQSLTDGELAETIRIAAVPGPADPDLFCCIVMSAVCEAARRVLGFAMHPNQVEAALAMKSRCVVEMPTGEGKTLSAILTAIWLGMDGNGVHILTFNDYLADRDYRWMGPICRLLGRTTGCVTAASTSSERRKAYLADVVWLTARESGFDHLRDGLVLDVEDLVQRPFHAAIVDEADSLLIDEARIPMVLAGGSEEDSVSVGRISQAVASLSRLTDLILDRNEQQVTLSDSGIGKMEVQLGVENLYESESDGLLARIHAALTARFLIDRDREYIIRDGRILLVDPHTGRIADNRHWPVLLQEALEVKEGLPVSRNGRMLGTVTTRHFLRMYPHLSGMTGTARTSAGELERVYGLKVVSVAPHRPCIRKDHPDRVHPDRQAKWDEVCRETMENHGKGRPVLIGTVDVAESEAFARRLLAEGIPCRVLNARNDGEEAAIIAEAGMPGAVTVSTTWRGGALTSAWAVQTRNGGMRLPRQVDSLYSVQPGMNIAGWTCSSVAAQAARGTRGKTGSTSALKTTSLSATDFPICFPTGSKCACGMGYQNGEIRLSSGLSTQGRDWWKVIMKISAISWQSMRRCRNSSGSWCGGRGWPCWEAVCRNLRRKTCCRICTGLVSLHPGRKP